MANWIITDSINLRHPTNYVQGASEEVLMLPIDNKAHTWEVIVRDGDADADLSGKSCYAYFVRTDNAKVLVNGTITNNVCSVTLDSTCYALPGFLRAVMIMSDTHQTVAICEKTFRVNPALPGQTVDPGEVLPSIDDLLAELGAMRLATTAANTAASAAQSATTAANTAAQNANAKAAAAQTATTNATQATAAANQAASSANTAAQTANTKAEAAQAAANNAYQATTAAIAATDAAQTAADDANEAAQNANEAAFTITTQIDRLDRMDNIQNARLTNIESVTEGYLYNDVKDSETAYSKTVPDGTLPYANLDMVGGKTLVWNQYSELSRYTKGSITNLVPDGENKQVPASTVGNYFAATITNAFKSDPVPGHKYFISFDTKSSKVYSCGVGVGYYIPIGTVNKTPDVWEHVAIVKNAPDTNAYGTSFYLFTNASPRVFTEEDYVAVKNVKVVNLTVMFGAGNEPTAEEFEAMFPADYYPYSEPTLMSFSADKVVSKGKNLLDLKKWYDATETEHEQKGLSITYSETEHCYVLNGTTSMASSASTFVSFDLDKALPYREGMVIGLKYFGGTIAKNGAPYSVFFIGGSLTQSGSSNWSTVEMTESDIFVQPPHTVPFVFNYVTKIWFYISGGVTFNNYKVRPIIAYSETFEPYFESTTDLSTLVQKYFPDGMKSAGTVHDSFEQDETGKWWAVQRVGSVDLGTVEWNAYSSEYHGCVAQIATIGSKRGDDFACPKYMNAGENAWIFGGMPNKTIVIEPQYINCVDTDCNSASDFASQNAGVNLFYELANYIRTEVTDTFPSSISVETGGTITFANDQGDDYRVPLPNAETWKFNIEDDAVRYDTEQTLTDEQKITARNNIGAADKDEVIELNEDVSVLQDDVEDIKRRIDSGDISVPDSPGSSIVEEKNAYHLRLAKIQYTSFGDSYWGTTPEEKARNIAKFDIHVSGGINSDTLPIIRRAKEINPNLKICAYISVASGRPSFDKDANDLSKPWGWYTFRRDGSWDNEYASQFFPVYGVNLTVPFNKWQILQQIEEFAHVGGHKTGERELVDTYTWIDENGVSHTDNKYIDKWTGGTSYDGIFWDDVGFDHIIDEGTFFETDNSTEPIDSVKRQGFASRRDKYICINNFTHDRGMFVIPNSINKEDLYDPAVSNENPDGLGSSLTENDYVFVESFLSMIGTANSVNWRNEVNRVKTYMDDWYDTVKAKVIVEDYGYPMMDKETLNQFTTYAMATCVALGVHYYSITNVDNSLYVPNVIDLPVPTDETDRKSHLTRPASDIVKYSYAENTLSVIRNSELTRGEVTKYSVLNGIKILLNGNRLYNAFISAAESDAGLSDKLKELKTSIDDSISDTKQSASIYNRLMIDDWSVDKLEYTKLITDEAFTEFAQGSQNRFASDENVDVTYDVSERTITWTKNAADGNGMQSVPLNIRINREHYGHTIEVGYAIRTTGTGVGAWLDMRLDGDLWFEDGANPAKNTSALYPSREDMSVRRRTLIDYGDRDFVPLQFIATWNSNCLSATIENFYVIDVDEFDMDVSKTEYTNLMPAYEPNIQLGASRSFVMLPGSNSKSFTIDFENGSQPYNNGDGAGWWLDKSIFTPGHTYELGIKDVERNSGAYAMKLNVRIGLGDDDYIRNTVEFHEKYDSKIFPETKTYNRRFTIPEDAVLTNPLLEFASYYGDYNNQEGTKPKSIVIHDWYLIDCDEENVIIRGVTPAQTSIRICRVTEESLSKDIQNETLINNALYLTDTGKIYFTDVNKTLVKEEHSSEVSNVAFNPIVCWGDSLTYGYSDPLDNNSFDGYSKSRFDHRQRICYPSALAEMVGRPVINLGVSGETCQTIMARQGADPMLTPAFTIPADTTPVEIGTFGNLYNGGLRTKSGRNATILGYGNSGINPCYIKGVKGYLTATGQRSDRSGIKYYFQRETAGAEVSVPDGTVIQTYAMRNLRKGVAIIWMGYNGQFNGPQDMVNKINSMIEYGHYSDYLVLTCNESYADDSYGFYKAAWGNRFLYLRPLLGRIGVQEAGLWSDGTLKDNGIAQELDYDGVHFNSYGCKAIASFVFKRLLENGSLSKIEEPEEEPDDPNIPGGEDPDDQPVSSPVVDHIDLDGTYNGKHYILKSNEEFTLGRDAYYVTDFAPYGTDLAANDFTMCMKFTGTPSDEMALYTANYNKSYGDQRGVSAVWDGSTVSFVLGNNTFNLASGGCTVNSDGANTLILRKQGTTFGVYCNGAWMYSNPSMGSNVTGAAHLANLKLLLGANRSSGNKDNIVQSAGTLAVSNIILYDSALSNNEITEYQFPA